jgi:sorbose reductase
MPSLLTRRLISSRAKPLLSISRFNKTPSFVASARAFSTSRRYNEDISDIKVTDRMSLQGRNFLVTGGGRGIGFAICKAIAQMGGNVAVIDALPEPVEEFHSLKDKYGTEATFRTADVTKEDSLNKAFEDAVSKHGSFQGCVPAAGIALDKPIGEHTWAESQRVLMVNTMGTFWTVKLVSDHMAKHGKGGSIVMIASIAAQGIKIPEQNLAIYHMSKAAVKGLVGPLAVELSESNIRVNSISPGVILSPMTNALKTELPKLAQMFENAAPVGRIGVPQDLTPAVIYLLSDAASFTTGLDMIVGGGFHAGVRPSWIARAMPQ